MTSRGLSATAELLVISDWTLLISGPCAKWDIQRTVLSNKSVFTVMTNAFQSLTATRMII